MSRQWTVFELARMRHLDLLATWHQYTPRPGNEQAGLQAGRMTKEHLVIAVAALQARAPRT